MISRRTTQLYSCDSQNSFTILTSAFVPKVRNLKIFYNSDVKIMVLIISSDPMNNFNSPKARLRGIIGKEYPHL
jgi:uncharacterized protein YabN with tetrapyrrole methylase and pyrophosphatase domain